ncbi:MAG: flavin reductase family protein, partial [Polyangia bacterium]|nr:flavin reductase family protein [Polyangia bacterium]
AARVHLLEQLPVVMIPHRELLEEMNSSSATFPFGVSEVEALGLSTVPFEGSRLPRVAGCRVAFACRRHLIQEIGNGPQALIIGLVGGIWLDDGVVDEDSKGRLKIRADRLDPVGRLGAGEYAFIGEIRRLVRPD